jgi:hypothetical protein
MPNEMRTNGLRDGRAGDGDSEDVDDVEDAARAAGPADASEGEDMGGALSLGRQGVEGPQRSHEVVGVAAVWGIER